MNDTAGDLTEARILPTEDETNTSTPAQPTPSQQPTPAQQPTPVQPTPASQAESVMQSIQQNTTDLLLQNNLSQA